MDTIAEENLYAINLSWFEQNKVSFSDVARRRVCASCDKKSASDKLKQPADFIKWITGCCAKDKSYIHSQQPIAESIFRFFLSNGNKPLSAEDIMIRVNEKRGDNPMSISTEALQQMLDARKFLGLGPFSAKS